MLINGSANRREFFTMPMVKSSVTRRELLVKANLNSYRKKAYFYAN